MRMNLRVKNDDLFLLAKDLFLLVKDLSLHVKDLLLLVKHIERHLLAPFFNIIQSNLLI